MTGCPSFPFAAGPASEPPEQYARLRGSGELPRVRLASGREALLVTRYDDVKRVLADPGCSRAAYTAGTLFNRSAESLPLVTTDAPVHSRRRSAVARAFTANRVRRLRPMIEELAAEQLGELVRGPVPADLVGRYTVPFALRVMCRILGVPDEDIRRFPRWVEPMMSIGRHPPEQVARCHRELHDYFAELVAATRDRPTPGLIADLLAPRTEARALSPQETVTMVAGLLVAGFETTSNELAAAMYQLLRRPELTARLRDDPDTVATTVEELLRFLCINGTGGVPHVATTDVPLTGGEVIAAGEVVVPVPDAANRDPAVFDEPDRLRTDRRHNPHVAFGHGPHYCLGAELARLELRIGITTLLTALPGLRLAAADAELRWRTDMFVRGLWELPVAW